MRAADYGVDMLPFGKLLDMAHRIDDAAMGAASN
jgi:hypothetical protein